MKSDSLLKSFLQDEQFHREELTDAKIVFVHDSFHRENGITYEFTEEEFGVLSHLLEKTKLPANSYQFVASIKSYGLREDDVSTAMLTKHREYLYEDLDSIVPTLIIPLGNLPMKAVIKKSGIYNKRGKEFPFPLGGHSNIPVVPTFHPVSLYLEPKLRHLFIQDINNAYEKFILDANKQSDTGYVLCDTLDSVEEQFELIKHDKEIAVDLETTGLDYKKDKIQTIGIATDSAVFILPLYHKDSPFVESEIAFIREKMATLCADETKAKIFHNCKFDLKFLMNFEISDFKNIEDTQMIHSLIDENLPHGLMDLVKQYFPQELETF